MEFLTIVLLLALVINIGLGIFAVFRVVKTCQLTRKQKTINIILIVLIPFFWSLLMYYMFKKLPESYEIDPKDKFKSDDFHESGIGISPGAHL